MSANFLSLPRELRDNIYELLLVVQEPIVCSTQPWLRDSKLRALTPGLLLANKTVHLEASLMLYGQNRFDFTMCSSGDVTSFLEQIGRNNASHILSINIDFPTFHSLELNDITLVDDCVRILTTIQSNCTKLSTLITSLHSTDTMEVTLYVLDSPEIVAEALALVDARFRAISSLKEIIVELYENGPSDYIRMEMKNHGWTIRATECVEGADFDRSFSDFEDDDHRSDHDDDYGDDRDDYDIDDDSDFWRRAGD